MTVPLSSRMTGFFKFVFPVVWGGAWSRSTYLLFRHPDLVQWNDGGMAPPWAKWVWLAVLGLGGYVCAAGSILKVVWLENDLLVVSNYRHRMTIPLDEISAAGIDSGEQYEVGLGIGPVGIHESRPTCVLEFRDPTRFGRRVTFIPRSKEALRVLRSRLNPEVGHGLKEPPSGTHREPEEFYGKGLV